METKKCSKCGAEKALCEFWKDKDKKDGLRSACKACVKAYREANKEKIAKRHKAYLKANKEKIREQQKAYREKNKSHRKKNQKIYREANKEKKRAYDRKRRKLRAAQERERKRKDPAYKLRCLVSTRVWDALKNQSATKGGKTFSALPYAPSDLVEHLEKQFDETMTWENYGDYWEVDHIYPQSLLPYDSLDHPNFQKCWALDNLQPLEKSENRAKSNKVLDA